MEAGMRLSWSAAVSAFDSNRDTADPLGFRGWANQLARDLVPGLTQVTWRTRGYSLLCKGLQLAKDVEEKKGKNAVEAFLRFERLWVGAQREVHGERARWAGVRMASLLLAEDSYRLDRPLTSQQLYSGLWGAYRRSATALGLIQPSGRRSGPAGYKLTALGHELAGAVAKAALSERVHLATHILKDSLPKEVLKSLIQSEHPGEQPSKREVEILSSAMRSADQSQDRALSRLRRVYDQQRSRSLDLDTLLHASELSETQRRSAMAARELCELMDTIEEPFRVWVTGGSVGPLSPAILDHPGWDTARSWPVPELVSLHDTIRARLKAESVLVALHRHHKQLMEQRGAEPWECDVETPSRRNYQSPDFCLPSAVRLFGEGVLQQQGVH